MNNTPHPTSQRIPRAKFQGIYEHIIRSQIFLKKEKAVQDKWKWEKNNSRIILSKTSGIGITRSPSSYFVFINKEGVKTIGKKQKTMKTF